MDSIPARRQYWALKTNSKILLEILQESMYQPAIPALFSLTAWFLLRQMTPHRNGRLLVAMRGFCRVFEDGVWIEEEDRFRERDREAMWRALEQRYDWRPRFRGIGRVWDAAAEEWVERETDWHEARNLGGRDRGEWMARDLVRQMQRDEAERRRRRARERHRPPSHEIMTAYVLGNGWLYPENMDMAVPRAIRAEFDVPGDVVPRAVREATDRFEMERRWQRERAQEQRRSISTANHVVDTSSSSSEDEESDV